MRRTDGSNCEACFLKGCDCNCETCVAARPRNNQLSSSALMVLQLADVMKVDVTEVKEYPDDFCIPKKIIEGR